MNLFTMIQMLLTIIFNIKKNFLFGRKNLSLLEAIISIYYSLAYSILNQKL